MSWVDDEILDIGYPYPLIAEDYWEEGMHQMKNGEVIDLEDMTTSHLKNTINYFKNKYDVSLLKKELKRRKI